MIDAITVRTRSVVYMLAAAAGLLALWLLVLRGGSSDLPHDPQALAREVTENDVALRESVHEWRAARQGSPPDEVTDRAQYLQRAARLLAGEPVLAQETAARLPTDLASEVQDLAVAYRDLNKLAGGGSGGDFDTQPARPIDELSGYYSEAESRYGIDASHLAAINLVETAFGKVSSSSVAGAQGPMQFIPSTWKLYGNGGDIHDPHDAILGAANLLKHSGAPGDYASALHAYNRSSLYVDAVQRYADVIGRDPDALYILYSWEPG